MRKNKNIAKWTLEDANKFGLEDFYTLFCSENCFEQSSYSKETKQSTTKDKEQKKSNLSQRSIQQTEQTQSEPLNCQSCFNEIPSNKNYYYNTQKNDHNKFCSKNCYTEFYGEFCIKCWKKFLMVYNVYEENNPNLTYCWDCKKEREKELAELFKKNCQDCGIELTDKETYLCKVCDIKQTERIIKEGYGENALKEKKGEKNKHIDPDSKQNRTECRQQILGGWSQLFKSANKKPPPRN